MWATLGRTNSKCLAIQVGRYQYPEIVEGMDANWLMILMLASDGKRRWWSYDPALLTTEVSSLAGWLRNVAAGIPPWED